LVDVEYLLALYYTLLCSYFPLSPTISIPGGEIAQVRDMLSPSNSAPSLGIFCSSNDVDGAIAKIKEMGIKAYAIGSVIPDSESSVIVEPKSIKGMGEQFQAI